jgi:beta-phosphoglucomutase family hydrolase
VRVCRDRKVGLNVFSISDEKGEVMKQIKNPITSEKYDAVLFDLDGVLTSTAKIHAKCWKLMFDDFLKKHAAENDEPFQPFDIGTDYKLYVDGRTRFEGVRSFLEFRDIQKPFGDRGDHPDQDTICGLANRKFEMVSKMIESEGVEAYEGSIALVRFLRESGFKTAVVSSSASCRAVLKSAKIDDLFDLVIDAEIAHQQKLSSKPAPDTYLAAAGQLGVEPIRAVVVEDAISGVQAGRAGGFGLVIGVDREGSAKELMENGADVVVTDLGEILPR